MGPMIELRKGDGFATAFPGQFGKAINGVQWLNNVDGESEYSHIGEIINEDGTTYEALGHYKRQNIFIDYAGVKVIIVRHKNMTPEAFEKGWNAIKHLEGKRYPLYRIPLFVFPFLAKVSLFKLPVCSEMRRLFMKHTGLMMAKESKRVFGYDPDDLVDRWRIHKDYEIIFEGTLSN